jgi:hypothetical protein
MEAGVIGKTLVSVGELARECSNEWECERGGVWRFGHQLLVG